MSHAACSQELVQPRRGRRYLVVDVSVEPRFSTLETCSTGHEVDMSTLVVGRIAVLEPSGIDGQRSQWCQFVEPLQFGRPPCGLADRLFQRGADRAHTALRAADRNRVGDVTCPVSSCLSTGSFATSA